MGKIEKLAQGSGAIMEVFLVEEDFGLGFDRGLENIYVFSKFVQE